MRHCAHVHTCAVWLQVFKEAVEEAAELTDRRAGRQPATQHHPLDFRVEKPEYNADAAAPMTLEERFPPLGDAEAVAIDVAEALASLQRGARSAMALADGGDTALRLAVWCRFHLAPRKLQRAMAPGQAGVHLGLATGMRQCRLAHSASVAARCKLSTSHGLVSHVRHTYLSDQSGIGCYCSRRA